MAAIPSTPIPESRPLPTHAKPFANSAAWKSAGIPSVKPAKLAASTTKSVSEKKPAMVAPVLPVVQSTQGPKTANFGESLRELKSSHTKPTRVQREGHWEEIIKKQDDLMAAKHAEASTNVPSSGLIIMETFKQTSVGGDELSRKVIAKHPTELQLGAPPSSSEELTSSANLLPKKEQTSSRPQANPVSPFPTQERKPATVKAAKQAHSVDEHSSPAKIQARLKNPIIFVSGGTTAATMHRDKNENASSSPNDQSPATDKPTAPESAEKQSAEEQSTEEHSTEEQSTEEQSVEPQVEPGPSKAVPAEDIEPVDTEAGKLEDPPLIIYGSDPDDPYEDYAREKDRDETKKEAKARIWSLNRQYEQDMQARKRARQAESGAAAYDPTTDTSWGAPIDKKTRRLKKQTESKQAQVASAIIFDSEKALKMMGKNYTKGEALGKEGNKGIQEPIHTVFYTRGAGLGS